MFWQQSYNTFKSTTSNRLGSGMFSVGASMFDRLCLLLSSSGDG